MPTVAPPVSSVPYSSTTCISSESSSSSTAASLATLPRAGQLCAPAGDHRRQLSFRPWRWGRPALDAERHSGERSHHYPGSRLHRRRHGVRRASLAAPSEGARRGLAASRRLRGRRARLRHWLTLLLRTSHKTFFGGGPALCSTSRFSSPNPSLRPTWLMTMIPSRSS